jgi:hypothetical protein
MEEVGDETIGDQSIRCTDAGHRRHEDDGRIEG